MYVDDKKFNVQAEKAEDAAGAAGNAHEEWKKHMDMRSLELPLDEESKAGTNEVLNTSK